MSSENSSDDSSDEAVENKENKSAELMLRTIKRKSSTGTAKVKVNNIPEQPTQSMQNKCEKEDSDSSNNSSGSSDENEKEKETVKVIVRSKKDSSSED